MWINVSNMEQQPSKRILAAGGGILTMFRALWGAAPGEQSWWFSQCFWPTWATAQFCARWPCFRHFESCGGQDWNWEWPSSHHRVRLSWGWLSSLGKAASEGKCCEDKCMGMHADGLTEDGFVCAWACVWLGMHEDSHVSLDGLTCRSSSTHTQGHASGWTCVDGLTNGHVVSVQTDGHNGVLVIRKSQGWDCHHCYHHWVKLG